MKLKFGDSAVGEIIGSVVLLAMAVVFFSVIYMNVLSDDGPQDQTFVTLVGSITNENGDEYPDIVFEHNRGESLGLDTEVILDIGGGDKIFHLPITDYIIEKWNIGERFIYYPKYDDGTPIDLNNVNVRANILDKKTNSLVFWGTLQEGWVLGSFGKGGIWHFNESFWNGTALEVKDSSGNNNHGTAYNDANTTDDIVSSLANRSGSFNLIDYDDYVEVVDAYSLDLTNSMTMEAWIKPFSDYASNTVTLLDQFGYTPYITNISGSKYLFAVVSEDKQKLNMQTVNLTPHKPLSENNIIDMEYEIGDGKLNQYVIRPIITHISDNVYLVAYNNVGVNEDLNINLKTFNLSSNGYINYTGNKIYDENESNIGEINRPSIVKVSDFELYSIFAIVYCIYVDEYHPSVGIIKTVNISHDGKIKFTGYTSNFDDFKGYEPSIINVADKLFAIAYRNALNHGIVKTFNISSNGFIEYTGNEFVFDNIKCYESSIINISSDIFAIAYRGPSDQGIIKTLNISSNGSVLSIVNNKIFESSYCFDPFIIRHTENYFIIAYSTTNNYGNGKYSAIKIAKNGSILLIFNKMLDLSFQQNQKCYNPIAFKISERGFGIIFRGQAGGNGHPGYLIPIQIEYPSDLYSKGIYKLGSYGIYANFTDVSVNINTKTISAPIVGNSWNYVVLTYDRKQIKLYVNGILKNYIPMTETIKITNNNLIFGDLFYGLIDEVGIYDKVLSNQDIYNHFKVLAPIIISNVNISAITYNSAKITWETNIPSNSIVRYGITTLEKTVSGSTGLLHSITLTSLNPKTTYIYEVESTGAGFTIIDNNGGRYYTFTTENIPPNVPRLPNPDNDSNNIKTDTILSWIGGDEDGDNVLYDVYLWSTNPPIIVSHNQSVENYDPNPDLIPNTMYYWKIIARDSIGAITVGPIWHFTTKK